MFILLVNKVFHSTFCGYKEIFATAVRNFACILFFTAVII